MNIFRHGVHVINLPGGRKNSRFGERQRCSGLHLRNVAYTCLGIGRFGDTLLLIPSPSILVLRLLHAARWRFGIGIGIGIGIGMGMA